MSQQPSQFGQQAQRMEGQGRQSNYARDPATGRFLTDEEQAQVARLAQQYPRQVEQAYAQNVPFSAVGLQFPTNIGEEGQQTSGGTGRTPQQTRQGTWQGGQQQGSWQQTQPQQLQQPQQGGGQQVQQPQQQSWQQPQQSGQQQTQGETGPLGQQALRQLGRSRQQQERLENQQEQQYPTESQTPAFREEMSVVAQQRQRDPQTGQFLPQGSQGQQLQGQQRR